MGGTTTNRIQGCIKHGPWGGSQGEYWLYMPEEGYIKKITIVHAGFIDRIRFQSDCHTQTGETQTSIFGGSGGKKTDTICIDYPNEYLTSISGTIDNSGGSFSPPMLMSLSFHTNQIRYGPYGNSDKGTPFSYDGKDGMIIGFYGRFGQYINAIGIYVIPKSLSPSLSPNSAPKNNSNSMHELCCEMSGAGMPREAGPWGAAGGKPWDDGVFSHVKQIRVYLGESLKVDLDGEKECLTGISGFYGPVVEFNGLEGITSITIHTNKKIVWARKWRRVCLFYIIIISWEGGWFSRQEW
uniref:Jacalin-type lectin domain-containing protein n=1 Tax=Lactuca sativa TaxID=4236 RepID=A0A9R1WSE4_LACSA|nr:hypothetical protein LSAT_V11C100007950 [Lactuca sativa]